MTPIPKKPLTKKRIISILAVSLAVLLLLTLFVYLMFTGDIHIRYDQSSFTVEADFMSDLTVDYEAIDSVLYLENIDFGMRVSGFNSARLLMGSFHNKEYGKYTLYSYVACEAVVQLRSEDRILIIGGKTPEETMKIYKDIKERVQ